MPQTGPHKMYALVDESINPENMTPDDIIESFIDDEPTPGTGEKVVSWTLDD